MKKLVGMAMILGTLAGASGCSYGGVAVAGDKAVVARNDGFLFGLLRKVVVCKVTDAGLTNCNSSDTP
jgi:hypothetical protein